jgi:class 3 adenylate cyclase
LDQCFKAFDAIVEAHGVEKIKTIGDAYMAAGGLPDALKGDPLQTILAALDMQEFMREYKQRQAAMGRLYFEMRAGLHTGPVIAGIVGVKKYAYDIWGDTVNVANRMESCGEVGCVNISESTYERVKHVPGLAFTARGAIEAKGKGLMPMYFVQRIPAALHVVARA